MKSALEISRAAPSLCPYGAFLARPTRELLLSSHGATHAYQLIDLGLFILVPRTLNFLQYKVMARIPRLTNEKDVIILNMQNNIV